MLLLVEPLRAVGFVVELAVVAVAVAVAVAEYLV